LVQENRRISSSGLSATIRPHSAPGSATASPGADTEVRSFDAQQDYYRDNRRHTPRCTRN